MKIKGRIIEHPSISKKLSEQKGNESLRAKVQSLLQLEACQDAKKGYLAESRIAKLFSNYTLKPTIVWDLVKNDETVQPVAKRNLPEHKDRVVH